MKRVTSIFILIAVFMGLSTNPAISAELKEWTIAVFLNADNNLDPFGVEDQEEMSQVGSNEWLNVVSLIDREHGPAQINYIEKNNIKKVKDMGELDMGDYNEFVNFIRYIKKNYPAKHYCITIWNHGSGWKHHGTSNITRGISYDDSSNNHITNAQLGKSMAQAEKILGQKVDILNMDACLMQMVEVAYAVKDHTNYMVASEELEPGKGAPYADILNILKKDSTPKQFATKWVDAFINSYDGGSQGYDEATQSALDLSKIDNLIDAINGFAKATMSGKYAKPFDYSLRNCQKFQEEENIDLIHFLECLQSYTKNDEGMKTAINKLIKTCNAAIMKSKAVGFSTTNAKGIAIYLPSNFTVASKYKTLKFAKDTMWDDMIETLHKRKIVVQIVDEIKENKTSLNLKKFVAWAENNPHSKRTIRAIIRALNYEIYSEMRLEGSLKKEIDELFVSLKAVLA